jgi:ABC transporter ATM
MEELYKLKQQKSTIVDGENAATLTCGGKCNITFQNVSFAYPDEERRQIFTDLSFEVPSGSTMAIVGPSGCGKSSVLRLLFRYFDSTNGTIKIGEQHLKDIQLDDLRKAIR